MPSGELEFPEIAAVYARFAALMDLSADVGGWLMLYSGLDRDGIAVGMAGNIAGAASLGIEPDATRAKAALRAGICDFVVNNLDEALRILKNEIRKKQPVSVVVTTDVDATITEIVERGLQPEVVAFPVRALMERGATLIEGEPQSDMETVTWSVASEPTRWLPVVDALAAASVGNAGARRRWIEASPRYLGRAFAGQRYVRMAGAEAEAFVRAAGEKARMRRIDVVVAIKRDGELTSIRGQGSVADSRAAE